MTGLLAGGIARIVHSATKGLFLSATLTRKTIGAGANDWEPGAETALDYPCLAIVDGYSDYSVANGIAKASECKVMILARSLTIEPQQGDAINVESRGRFTVVSDGAGAPAVSTDPAKAVWVCRCLA